MTRSLKIHGYHQHAEKFGNLAVYGSDAVAIQDLISSEPVLGVRLHSELPYVDAEVVWAVRKEMARSVEDVLSRRTRALLLNARAAIEMAPRVAEIMAAELGRPERWVAIQVELFERLAANYIVN